MANNIERIGVGHCMEVAEQNKWMFREQPVDDVGIDAYMEVTDNIGKMRQLLALQIKSGESYFAEKNGEYVIYRGISEKHYNYWTTHSLPCIIVLFNPNDETCIWQKLTLETIEKTKCGNGYYVKVPMNHVFLDGISNKMLLSYSNLPEQISNYNFLVSQEYFMRIIKRGGKVTLHSREWVNKSSGRGETELIVDDGKGKATYAYPYWFPFTPYDIVFSQLFPWADFKANEEFYEDTDMSDWRENHCYYDKEEDRWIIVGDSFEEYRSKLDPMRAINYSGEVAEYMLDLQLNELGNAFLTVNDYVSKTKLYSDVRPKTKKWRAKDEKKDKFVLECKV